MRLVMHIFRYTRADYIFSFVLKVRKKTNIQLNIYPHNTLHNNFEDMYSIIIRITIYLHNAINT